MDVPAEFSRAPFPSLPQRRKGCTRMHLLHCCWRAHLMFPLSHPATFFSSPCAWGAHSADARKHSAAIKCSFKANEGSLFVLERSLLFLHKPTFCLKFAEMTGVEVRACVRPHFPFLSRSHALLGAPSTLPALPVLAYPLSSA